MRALIVPLVLLAACAEVAPGARPPEADVAAPDDAVRPQPRPAGLGGALVAPLPEVGAITAEALDTTTEAQRSEAAAAAEAPGERLLGRTIASLGNPVEPGFWLETPLVSAVTLGRIVLPQTGTSVQVELRPISGAPTAGSRISLPAIRLLGVPLTALPEIEVYVL